MTQFDTYSPGTLLMSMTWLTLYPVGRGTSCGILPPGSIVIVISLQKRQVETPSITILTDLCNLYEVFIWRDPDNLVFKNI